MNQLNKFYKTILEAMGCVIHSDYSIWMKYQSTEFPVKVDGKQLYMATTDAMEVVDLNRERAFFNPASESISSKETEVDKTIRKLMTACIYQYFQIIPEVLFKVASKKSNKTLPASVQAALEPLKISSNQVKEEIINLISKISMEIESDGVDTRIIHFSVTRGGKTPEGESIKFKCVPVFPYYTELFRVLNQNNHLKETDTIIFAEQKYTIRSARAIIALFNFIIPSVQDPSALEGYSVLPTAARLTAMLSCFGLVCKDINGTISKFRKDFNERLVYDINTEWLEELDELTEISGLIPALDYNSYNSVSYDQAPLGSPGNISVNPFETTSTSVVNNAGFSITNANPNQSNKVVVPPPPQTYPTEKYIGVQILSNGLFEYRFQDNSNGNIRVVCLNDQGRHVSEQLQNPMGQPLFNNSQWGNNQWNNNQWGNNQWGNGPWGGSQYATGTIPPNWNIQQPNNNNGSGPGFWDGYAQQNNNGFNNQAMGSGFSFP